MFACPDAEVFGPASGSARLQRHFRCPGTASVTRVHDPSPPSGLTISKRPPKQTNLLAERAPNDAQQLHRAIGLGHVMVAASSPRLLLVALHRKRAHGNDGRCRK